MKKPYSDKRWYENPGLKKIESQCCECKYYNWNRTCKAFPEEIPRELFLNKVAHNQPYRGDKGILFEEK